MYGPGGYPGAYNDVYRGNTTRSYAPTEKMEEELVLHVKKALSTDECSPKQKHVRACIVYTWDIKGSGSLWNTLRSYPLVGDEVVIFKALVTIHKIINQGHPNVSIIYSMDSFYMNICGERQLFFFPLFSLSKIKV